MHRGEGDGVFSVLAASSPELLDRRLQARGVFGGLFGEQIALGVVGNNGHLQPAGARCGQVLHEAANFASDIAHQQGRLVGLFHDPHHQRFAQLERIANLGGNVPDGFNFRGGGPRCGGRRICVVLFAFRAAVANAFRSRVVALGPVGARALLEIFPFADEPGLGRGDLN